ncbi:MAG: hypothetical protein U0638_10645 [Phycisphaerales bacterium]
MLACKHSSPSCPRCGYDLSGAVAAWNHAESASCPMRGTCSECGLEFAWGEVLNPEISVPAWSFEHARSQHMSRFVRTLLLCFRPWRLWRSLQMHNSVNPARLVLLVLVGAPAAHLALMSLRFVSFALTEPDRRGVLTATDWLLGAANACWPYGDGLDWYQINMSGGVTPAAFLSFDSVWGAIWWSIIPLMFVLIPITLRSCRVRPAHIARIAAYWLVCSALALPLVARLHIIADAVLHPTNLLLHRVGLLGSYWYTNAIDELRHILVWQQPLCLWGVAFVFWGYALRSYLKLPRARLVAGMLVFLAGLVAILVAAAACYLVPGHLFERYFFDFI